MGCFERRKWREEKMPCKRALSLRGCPARLGLKIPGFGETHGVRAVRGGNPKGNAIMTRFLHKFQTENVTQKAQDE